MTAKHSVLISLAMLSAVAPPVVTQTDQKKTADDVVSPMGVMMGMM